MKKGTIITIFCIFSIFQSEGLCSANKVALVIGNSAYREAPLRNAGNDANALTETLTELGFAVTKKLNLTQQDMENAIRQFGKDVRPNDVALFYYSGHGVQVDGVNYLLPVDVNIDAADEIKYKAVAADMILDKLEGTGSQLNLIILDACRNNPFKRVRSLDKGLAVMSAPTGTLIAYATAPGTTAADGDGSNSPYTGHLLKVMRTPGLEIEKVFKQVRIAVVAETGGKQVPWESSSLTGDFMFVAPHNMVIQASQRWQKSEIFVKIGDIVTITYISGQWSTCPEWEALPSPYTGPEGHVGVADTKYPGSVGPYLLPGAEIMALLYRIGVDGSPGSVGKKTTFTAKHEGFLWFSANDDNFADNKGSLTIRITIE